MGKKRTTVQFFQFRLTDSDLRKLFKLVGCEWTKDLEKQWEEILGGKRQSLDYPQEFINKFKTFIIEEAPALRQSRLFDLSNVEEISPDLLSSKVLEVIYSKMTRHQKTNLDAQRARYDKEEAIRIRRLNGYDQDIKEMGLIVQNAKDLYLQRINRDRLVEVIDVLKRQKADAETHLKEKQYELEVTEREILMMRNFNAWYLGLAEDEKKLVDSRLVKIAEFARTLICEPTKVAYLTAFLEKELGIDPENFAHVYQEVLRKQRKKALERGEKYWKIP